MVIGRYYDWIKEDNMSEETERKRNATESFSIPSFAYERLELNRFYTVRRLVPLIIAHYVENEKRKYNSL